MPEGRTGYLKQDLNGTTELRTLSIDFVYLLDANDTLVSSPAPQVEQYAETPLASPLTITNVGVTETVVLGDCTGGTLGAIYSISVTVQTAQGKTLVGSHGIKIVPSR